MKEFGIFAMNEELERTEQIAKESVMEYVRTEKLSSLERMLLGVSFAAPDMYRVIVSGTEDQFDELVKNDQQEMTRVW